MGVPSARRLSGPGGRWLLGCRSAGAITGTEERLGPDHIWAPRVGREGLPPGAIARDLRPVDTAPLHCFSSPWVSHPSRVTGAGSRALVARRFGERYELRPP